MGTGPPVEHTRETSIRDNVKSVLESLPGNVELVAAAKTRSPKEILAAVKAGVTAIGENYVREAEEAFAVIGHNAVWHFIGHLQRNKVKKAVRIFDMIETIDCLSLAEEVDKSSRDTGRVMPVLVEINSGREEQKYGVFPEKAGDLIRKIAMLPNIKVRGLMTMGPFSGDPENARPYFRETRKIFNEIAGQDISGLEMSCLSMGMSNSYRVAIEEGATMVRIGTGIFGERD